MSEAVPIIGEAPAPYVPPPGKVIQIVAWRYLLLALTDLGDIWVLQGRETTIPGSVGVPLQWRKLVCQVNVDEPMTTF